MKSGIYQILNTVNGKRYVGSASDFKVRWKQHKRELRKNRHHAPHLQHAWNKYGERAFKFEVLLTCEKEDLIAYEQLHFDELKPEYNVAKIAGSALGTKRTEEQCRCISERLKGHIISEETKEKIRIGNQNKVLSEEHKQKISRAQKGKVVSEETRLKMSAWQIGRKMSDEARAKMSAAKKGKPANRAKTEMSDEIKAKISATKKRNHVIKTVLVNWGCAL